MRHEIGRYRVPVGRELKFGHGLSGKPGGVYAGGLPDIQFLEVSSEDPTGRKRTVIDRIDQHNLGFEDRRRRKPLQHRGDLLHKDELDIWWQNQEQTEQ